MDFLKSSPSFFLNLWMAACKTLAQGGIAPGSGIITAIGANGVDFGLQVGSLPGKWWTAPAAPPQGALENGFTREQSLPAIGDSAIVDAFGFGCMAMHHSPRQHEALSRFMPEPSASLGQSLLLGTHALFSTPTVRIACSVRNAVNTDKTLPIALGILDKEGQHGRIGGGIALVPPSVMQDACNALAIEESLPPYA